MKILNAWLIVIAIFVFMVLGVSQATAASIPRMIYGVNSIGPVLIFIFISGITVLVLDVFRSRIRFILLHPHTFRAASLLKRRIPRIERTSLELHSNTESPEIDSLKVQKELDPANLQSPPERLSTSSDPDDYVFDGDNQF